MKTRINVPNYAPGGNNELLRGFSAQSLTSLCCLGDMIGDRLTLLATYLHERIVKNPIRRANGKIEIPVVPLVIMDGNGPANSSMGADEYDAQYIRNDIIEAITTSSTVTRVRNQRIDQICLLLDVNKNGRSANDVATDIVSAYQLSQTGIQPQSAQIATLQTAARTASARQAAQHQQAAAQPFSVQNFAQRFASTQAMQTAMQPSFTQQLAQQTTADTALVRQADALGI